MWPSSFVALLCDVFPSVGGAVYLTYQHHNEHAPAFFAIATELGFIVEQEVLALGWAGRGADFLLREERHDRDGPVYMSKLSFPKGSRSAKSM